MINFKPVQQNIEFFNIVKPLGASISLSNGETVKADIVDVLPSGGIVLRIKDSYITVKTEIPLTKENQLLLKVLDVKDNTIKMQIVDITSKKGEVIQSITHMIKSNPDILIMAFDKLPPQTQKELIDFLENQFKTSVSIQEPNNFIDISELSPHTLRQVIFNSGLFFENKLSDIAKVTENIKNLLQTFPEKLKHEFESSFKELNIKNFEKLIPKLMDIVRNNQNEDLIKELSILNEKLQQLSQDLKLDENFQPAVETSQEISILTNSLYGFLPIKWEGLRFSDFKYTKKIVNNNKTHYFIVNLDFEDGKLSVITQLTQDNLSVIFFVENQNLKKELTAQKSQLIHHLKNQGFSIEFIEILPYGEYNMENYV